jgi:hypothetical protein
MVKVQLEGLGQLKNPMTSLGIEPTTFRLVAQCPNQLHYCMPQAKHTGQVRKSKGNKEE